MSNECSPSRRLRQRRRREVSSGGRTNTAWGRALAVASLLLVSIAKAHGPIADVQTNAPSPDIQNETTIVAFKQCATAGAPMPDDVVLVAYNNKLPGVPPNVFPVSTIGLDRSTDGGVTFPVGLTLSPLQFYANPVLAVGPPPPPPADPPCGLPGGAVPPPPPVYLASQIPPCTPLGCQIGLSTSLDGGQTWGPPFPVSIGLPSSQEKPWIDVDLATGTQYVCWTDFFPAGVILMSSTDGLYFNSPVSASPPATPIVLATGCQVKIDSDANTAFLAWYQGAGPTGTPAIMFTSCPLAGPPCAPPTAVDISVQEVGTPLAACGGCRALNGDIGAAELPLPTLTVSDTSLLGQTSFITSWHDGRFEIPFAVPVDEDADGSFDEDPFNGLDDDGDGLVDEDAANPLADIVAAISVDMGATWTRPVRVNDDPLGNGADQFTPTIYSRGASKLQWYDRREDPANTNMRLWGGFSMWGGLFWTNEMISDVLFPPWVPGPATGLRPCYMGDYNGLTFDAIISPPNQGPHFLHVWGDNRNGDPDVFFDLQDLQLPQNPVFPLLEQDPSFSLAAGGPSVLSGAFHPADILGRDPGGFPVVGIVCSELGLSVDGCDDGDDGDQDDLVAVSYGNDFQPQGPVHAIAFSVEPGSLGVDLSGVATEAGCPTPEPHADEFLAAPAGSNVQVLDGNGISCGGLPASGLGLSESASGDNLDALHGRSPASIAPAGTPTSPVYFTLGPASPSLTTLGATSADILQTQDGDPPSIFATPAQLGLVAGDRISGICLLVDNDVAFDENDLLLFTLGAASPTLTTIGATAADVLAPDIDGGVVDLPKVVIAAAAQGLLNTDVLDALKCEQHWVNDVGLSLSGPTQVSSTVGAPSAPAEINLELLNKGPAEVEAGVWLRAAATAGATATWAAQAGDECLGPPAPPTPEPNVDCTVGPVVGLKLQATLPVGTTLAARTLNLGCDAAGLYEVTVQAGLGTLALDTNPGNEFAELTLDLHCADQAGFVELAASEVSVGEGDGTATITVVRSGGTVGAIGVDFQTADGSATAGADYLSVSGTLFWGDGDGASKTFPVTILSDVSLEGNETVLLSLSNPQGTVLGLTNAATLTIGDLDPCAQPNVALSGITIPSNAVFEAAGMLSAGAFEILAPASVVFNAGVSIAIESGFAVAAGASFTAAIDPALACP